MHHKNCNFLHRLCVCTCRRNKVLCVQKRYNNTVCAGSYKNRKKLIWKRCDATQHFRFYFQCENLLYRNVDGDFKKSPVGIAASPCCEILFENEIFKLIMENQNVPKGCPVTAVSSHTAYTSYRVSHLTWNPPRQHVAAAS
jgi:hypothetical protein